MPIPSKVLFGIEVIELPLMSKIRRLVKPSKSDATRVVNPLLANDIARAGVDQSASASSFDFGNLSSSWH